jgi:CheY-like chemotaxis protein
MHYTVKTRTERTIVANVSEEKALQAVKDHPAPDVLTVKMNTEQISGDEFIIRFDN